MVWIACSSLYHGHQVGAAGQHMSPACCTGDHVARWRTCYRTCRGSRSIVVVQYPLLSNAFGVIDVRLSVLMIEPNKNGYRLHRLQLTVLKTAFSYFWNFEIFPQKFEALYIWNVNIIVIFTFFLLVGHWAPTVISTGVFSCMVMATPMGEDVDCSVKLSKVWHVSRDLVLE